MNRIAAIAARDGVIAVITQNGIIPTKAKVAVTSCTQGNHVIPFGPRQRLACFFISKEIIRDNHRRRAIREGGKAPHGRALNPPVIRWINSISRYAGNAKSARIRQPKDISGGKLQRLIGARQDNVINARGLVRTNICQINRLIARKEFNPIISCAANDGVRAFIKPEDIIAGATIKKHIIGAARR